MEDGFSGAWTVINRPVCDENSRQGEDFGELSKPLPLSRGRRTNPRGSDGASTRSILNSCNF